MIWEGEPTKTDLRREPMGILVVVVVVVLLLLLLLLDNDMG